MHDVFVSYATPDKQVADAIVHHLESIGIRCFIAPRDMKAGLAWPGQLVKGIKAATNSKPRPHWLRWGTIAFVCIAAYAFYPSANAAEKVVVRTVEDAANRRDKQGPQQQAKAEKKPKDSKAPPRATIIEEAPKRAIPIEEDDILTFTIQGKKVSIPVTRNPSKATKAMPYANKLDMLFVPLPRTKILFCIHETRVKDFAAFVKATGYDASKGMFTWREKGYWQFGDTWENPGFSQTDDHCVCGVSAEDAEAFCQWIGGGYRLPTDAEWSTAVGGLEAEDEKASPQDKSGQIKEVYPWGAWPDSSTKPPPQGAGNYCGEESKTGTEPYAWPVIPNYHDGFARTAPVCSFPPNRNGLYDLGGNVWEWTSSTWEKTSSGRVLRGASWNEPAASIMLSSLRDSNLPNFRLENVGFRCVVVVAGG